MKPDISSRKDIHFIMSEFYVKLLADEKMFPFFEDIIIQDTLEHHLDVITDFWEDILLDSKKYHNNTMKKHTDKHAFIQFKKVHFELWVSYLFETINAAFSGENTEQMKNRATSIATVMQLKMDIYKK